MNKNVIDYIIAAEFNTKSGNLISGIYPADFDLSLESLFIEKLIPDGVHNFAEDSFSFKNLVPVDSEKLKSFVEMFNAEKIEMSISEAGDCETVPKKTTIWINRDFEMLFVEKDVNEPVFKVELKTRFNFRSISPNVLIFTHFEAAKSVKNPEGKLEFYLEGNSNPRSFGFLIFILEMLVQSSSKSIIKSILKNENTNERVYCTMRFQTRVQTKKEKIFERGAVYKSVTIGTFLFADLKEFENYSTLVLADFMKVAPFETDSSVKYSPEVMRILSHYFDQQNVILSQPNFPFNGQTFLLAELPVLLNLEESVISQVVGIFKEQFMLIYREVLNEGKVVVYSQSMSIGALNKVVEAIRLSLLPMNFDSIFNPFETLTGIKLLQFEKSFVAGFKNPVIKMERSAWTLLVDMDEMVLWRPNGSLCSTEEVNLLDQQVVKNFLQFKNVTNTKIVKAFWNYNKMQIAHLLDEKECLNALPKSDLKIDLQKTLDKFKESSYFFKFRDDELLVQFYARKFFKEKGKDMLRAACFFGSDAFGSIVMADDMTVFYYLELVCRNCSEKQQKDAFLGILDFKNGLRKFVTLLFSGNSFVVERFLEFYVGVKENELLAAQVKDAGFVYEMMLKRKLQEMMKLDTHIEDEKVGK